MVFSRPNIILVSSVFTVHDDDDENEWHPYIILLLLIIYIQTRAGIRYPLHRSCINIILCIYRERRWYIYVCNYIVSALNDHNGHHVFKTRHINEIHVNFLHSHVTTIAALKKTLNFFYESQPTLSEYFSPCAHTTIII